MQTSELRDEGFGPVFAGTEEWLQSMANPLGAGGDQRVGKEKQISLNLSLVKFRIGEKNTYVDIGFGVCQTPFASS